MWRSTGARWPATRCSAWLLVQLGDREAVFLELGAPEVRWAIYRRETDDRLLSYFASEGEAVTSTGMFTYAHV